MRFSRITSFSCLSLAFLSGVSSCLGQDPFSEDTNTSPFNSPPTAENTAPASASSGQPSDSGPVFEPNAVVRSLLTRPPKTHFELARAVQLMSRIQRWDQVSRWMKAIEKLGITEPSAASMVDQVGAKTFVELTSPDVSIDDKEKGTARKILELAEKYRFNPAFIAQHVASLRSDERSRRLSGFRGLQSVGRIGIAALLKELMGPNAQPPTAAMCEAFQRFGQPAKAAWKAAIHTSHDDAKLNLLRLAMGCRDPQNNIEYNVDLSSWFANAAPEDSATAELRNQWIESRGTQVPDSAVYDIAVQRLEQSLKEYRKIRYDDDANTGLQWILNSDGRSVTSQECRPAVEVWGRVVGDADNVLLTGSATRRDSALAIAVKLEESGKSETADPILNSTSKLLDRYEYVCLIWDAAVAAELSYAKKLSVQNLGRFSQPMPVEVRERLVAALDCGVRSVRYASAIALMGTGHESFPGRSKMDRVLKEMSRLESRKSAALVGGSGSLRTHAKTILEEFNYEVAEFSNASNFIFECKSGLAIDAIFVVSGVMEMDLFQLVQRARATPAGETVPIMVLADSLSNQEVRMLGDLPRVVMGSIPPDGRGMADILRRAALVNQSPTLTEEERIAWKELVVQYLEDAAKKLVRAPRSNPGVGVPNTPLAQKALIAHALDNEKTMPEREQASQLFVQSVRQFGILISSETADAQYDVYNGRADKEPETKLLLGRILDAIEASRGKRDWDSIAP